MMPLDELIEKLHRLDANEERWSLRIKDQDCEKELQDFIRKVFAVANSLENAAKQIAGDCELLINAREDARGRVEAGEDIDGFETLIEDTDDVILDICEYLEKVHSVLYSDIPEIKKEPLVAAVLLSSPNRVDNVRLALRLGNLQGMHQHKHLLTRQRSKQASRNRPSDKDIESDAGFLSALKQHGGNVTRTAKELEIKRQGLYPRIEKIAKRLRVDKDEILDREKKFGTI